MKFPIWVLLALLLLSPVPAHATPDAGQDMYDALSYDNEDTNRCNMHEPSCHPKHAPLWFRIAFPIGITASLLLVFYALGRAQRSRWPLD